MRVFCICLKVLLFFLFLSCDTYKVNLNRYLTEETYLEKIKGAWLGQMIGVTFAEHFNLRWQNEIVPFNINNYMRIRPEIVKKMNRVLARSGGRNWTRIQNKFINQKKNWEAFQPSSVSDEDDLFLELIYLHTFEQGSFCTLTSKHFADDWLKYLSYDRIWHASRSAYLNFKKNIWPPQSGNVENNEHANGIDFQISSDIIGLISPGLPQASRKWSKIIGQMMCSDDGIYAGMFIAGMYSCAFFEKNIDTVIAAGLKSIPKESQFCNIINEVITLSKKKSDWKETWQIITDKWRCNDKNLQNKKNSLNMEAFLNSAYLTIGLIYGNGDFEKTLNIATRCGQNCIGNAANAAGILGCLLGENGIPADLKNPLKCTITNYSIQEIFPQKINLDDVVRKTALIGEKNINQNSGRIFKIFNKKILIIPYQKN